VTLACISGTSRGIGRATALELGRRGLRLALLARPSAEQDETEAALARAGTGFERFPCELEDPEATARACREVVERLGPPDAVIANAGTIERAPVEHTALGSWNAQLAVNLTAPFVMTRELLPSMRAAGRGRFIYVGSISSTLGTAGAAAYCASKWGLIGFMKSLSEELSDTGLMTAAVLPGSVDTRMLAGSGFSVRMTAEHVATTLVFLALDAPLAHNGGVTEMFGV
jgi:3-oxoacyl-[acyl-carrier protein] reductase